MVNEANCIYALNASSNISWIWTAIEIDTRIQSLGYRATL